MDTTNEITIEQIMSHKPYLNIVNEVFEYDPEMCFDMLNIKDKYNANAPLEDLYQIVITSFFYLFYSIYIKNTKEIDEETFKRGIQKGYIIVKFKKKVKKTNLDSNEYLSNFVLNYYHSENENLRNDQELLEKILYENEIGYEDFKICRKIFNGVRNIAKRII